jgi:3-isopropylmalate dehydrogenase
MTINKKILILAGDGIGPEVMQQAVRVLGSIAELHHHRFDYLQGDIGGSAFIKYGQHFPQVTADLCTQCDAILFGSVGGPIELAHLPQWHDCERQSILALRKFLKLNVNVRPACLFRELINISPLKNERLASGVSILIFRELAGDIYFGDHTRETRDGKQSASDVANYHEDQIAAIAHQAFHAAMKRKHLVTSIDKANVLATSQLWRDVVSQVATHYPSVSLQHMLVDNCAMQLMLNPGQFDVILTPNLFGDILSDEASAILGSLGLMPSASFNAAGFGLYEPSGGSAPDIAGKNLANPIAQILSAAMLLRHSFGLLQEAQQIEQAITATLAQGLRTRDICSLAEEPVGTVEFTDKLLTFL